MPDEEKQVAEWLIVLRLLSRISLILSVGFTAVAAAILVISGMKVINAPYLLASLTLAIVSATAHYTHKIFTHQSMQSGGR